MLLKPKGRKGLIVVCQMKQLELIFEIKDEPVKGDASVLSFRKILQHLDDKLKWGSYFSSTSKNKTGPN